MRTPVSFLLLCALVVAVAGEFKLLLLHTNDMHARFEQTSRISSKCGAKDVRENKCYGGFARVANRVKEARGRFASGKGPPVLFLNAGDNFQGSIWYSVHRWRIVAALTSLLGFDAMSLGNHEFDDGVNGLVPFIKNVSFPVLASNLDVSNEPSLESTHLAKSVVLTVQGRKVGIIGYLTPETKDISLPGFVVFKDEIQSIKFEVSRLKSEGVDILIALGHSGFAMDKRIAEEVLDIDVVIGGHTNTFLYTGKGYDPIDKVQGPYPTLVHQRSGRTVPVVQAYAYTKYLGQLNLTFDDRGEVTQWGGNPLLLDSTVPQDKTVLEALDVWRVEVQSQSLKKVGNTRVFLRGDGKYCRMAECNLGNFIADAMVSYFVSTNTKYEHGWTEAPIAIMHGGGIRADIDTSNEVENGAITMGDIMTTLPFENSLVFVEIKGKHILEALEWSVHKFDSQGLNAPGAFLQVSGMRVRYDMCKPKDHRVVSVMVRCGDCREPEYRPIDPKKTYGVLMPTYLAQGGDGYTINKNFITHRILDITDSGVLAEYIHKLSPIHPGVEGRILFSDKPCTGTYANNPGNTLRTQTNSVFVFTLGLLALKNHCLH